MHLLEEALEVGVEADAGEGQHEGPVLVLVEHAVDGLYVAAQRLDDEGSHKGGHEETDDELRETVPDLAGPDFGVAGLIDLGGEEDGHEEGDEANEDVLE